MSSSAEISLFAKDIFARVECKTSGPNLYQQREVEAAMLARKQKTYKLLEADDEDDDMVPVASLPKNEDTRSKKFRKRSELHDDTDDEVVRKGSQDRKVRYELFLAKWSMEPITPKRQSTEIFQNSERATALASSSAARLWRPVAQRNIRNQWSKLASLRCDWSSVAAAGRSHATSIINSYLSQKYMHGMEMNVLSDMPDIKKKARQKLLKQQELYRSKLLSSYRDMVTVVTHMVNACNSMRCYNRATSNSPLAQFSYSSEDSNDSGDCGGIPVFTFWSIALFEELAWEVVQMFISELKLKRLLVMDLLSIYDDNVAEVVGLNWSDEFYEGEFKDMCISNLLSKETCKPVPPSLESCISNTSTVQRKQKQNSDVLQVYITTWMVDVSINRSRVNEILTIVGSEMRANFLET